MEKIDATPEGMQAVVHTLKLVNDLEGEIKEIDEVTFKTFVCGLIDRYSELKGLNTEDIALDVFKTFVLVKGVII